MHRHCSVVRFVQPHDVREASNGPVWTEDRGSMVVNLYHFMASATIVDNGVVIREEGQDDCRSDQDQCSALSLSVKNTEVLLSLPLTIEVLFYTVVDTDHSYSWFSSGVVQAQLEVLHVSLVEHGKALFVCPA